MVEISLREYCEQIEAAIERGRYAEAVAHGKHILEQYPKHVDTYRLLGKVMLESNEHDYAADMFQRVLSADPEDLLAWVAMSEVYNQRDQLDAAVWHLERAFELASDNQIVEEELRHLYGRRDGIEPERVQLTRGALARLYLRGDLLSRAIRELRALLAEQPERVDLSVALAEALWRNEQRLEASEVCHQILDEQPHCIKANLILGQIWTSSGREEGQMYLRRAEALDPENKMAQELFGPDSPLLAREVQIAPLEAKPLIEEERPAWMAGVEAVAGEGPPAAEAEAALVDVTAALETQIEIPSWLEELTVGEEAEEQPPEEVAAPAAEEIPEWLPGAEAVSVGEEVEAVAEEEAPEWLSGLDLAPVGEEEAEMPAWLAEAAPELAVEEEVPAVPSEEEIPDWLAEAEAELALEEEMPAAAVEEEVPEWLAEAAPELAVEEEVPTAAPEEEVPEWLVDLGVEPEVEEAALPAWLEGEGLPSGDEALAWLEQLAEGKEEELRAQAQAEAEARMAEIMGRPESAAPPPEEAAPVEAVAPPAEEAVAPAVEEPFGWTAFGEAEAPPEAVAAVEEAPPPEEAAAPEVPAWAPPEEVAPAPVAEPEVEEAALPAWLEEEGLPSGDEALAWLEQLAEGKEEELRAQAQAEAEARMAEIMGRPEPAAPPPEEAVAPAVEEPFGWTAFGEAEAPPEAVAAVEEAPPPEEAAAPEVPAWAPPEEAAPAPVAEAEVEEAALPAWLEEEEMPPDEEALAWLEQLAEAEARMAEIMGRLKPAAPPPEEAAPVEAVAPPAEEAVAPAVEEPFGWTAFGEAEAPPEGVAAVEEAPPPEEAAPPQVPEMAYPEEFEAPPVAEMPTVEEAPAPEVAPPAEEVRWGGALEAMPEEKVAPTPVVEEVPGVMEMEVEVEMPALVEEAEAPPEAPITEAPAEPLAAERAHLKKQPRDYEAWIALARALWQAGEQQEALVAYTRVIRAGKLLESVIPDLEAYVQQWPGASIQQVLGDAYMKAGQLQHALDTYRQALESL